MEKENKIIVLDFGAQYAHLIARRVRELKVFSEIRDPETPVSELEKAKGIILSGGPSSVYEKNAPKFNKEIFSLDVPILGICYGHQLMGQELGGKVKPGKINEFGTAKVDVKNKDSLFKGMTDVESVWMSHGDAVQNLPPGFESVACTSDCDVAAMACDSKKRYGVQFHPEVTHTENGMKLLENFVIGICDCEQSWTIENYLEDEKTRIREQVGDKNVFILASGGVDSTVALALLGNALERERIYALHIDTGFMRKEETALVKKALEKLDLSKLHVVDASKEFFESVEGIVDPEEKRKIIGKKFIEVKDRELKKLSLEPEKWLLGQGTIYPDTIESSGTRNAAHIKTHHNRIESIKEMVEAGLVVEPLKELYKDEVRELGEKLGLPQDLVWRHPFPGPGLAIRCLCSDGKQDKEVVSVAEEKVKKIAEEFGLDAIVLPIKSVGVQGDARTYRHPAVLIGKAGYSVLEKASTRITNEVQEVNRVVWLVAPKKFKKTKLLKETLTRKRADLLREADAVVMKAVEDLGLMDDIWQFPTVLVPVSFNGKGESIVLRPVESKEAMTARFYELPIEFFEKVEKEILEVNGISALFLDITHKPPGTIEWE